MDRDREPNSAKTYLPLSGMLQPLVPRGSSPAPKGETVSPQAYTRVVPVRWTPKSLQAASLLHLQPRIGVPQAKGWLL